MGRMSFVLRRLVLLVPTAVGVTIITFFMVHLIPGNPPSPSSASAPTPAPSPPWTSSWA